MKNINIRVDDEFKEFLEQLKYENNHDSISSVIRDLIVDARKAYRTEQYLKGMEQRIMDKIDYLAEMAEL